MKQILGFIALFLLAACGDANKPGTNKYTFKARTKKARTTDSALKPMVKYTEVQLLAFLDSVGSLPTQPLTDDVAYGADSVYENFTKPLNRQLPAADFIALKKAALAGMIRASQIRKIFGEVLVDTTCTAKGILDSVKKGFVYLQYYPFDKDKNKFDEFAVEISDSWQCHGAEMYFFKGSKIIARQHVDGSKDEAYYYKNTGEQAVVYRTIEFSRGSGIWWFNKFFYKYDGDKLIPVLNILENGNMQAFWGPRVLWLESKIQSTNPLKLKMVYYGQFYTRTDDKEMFKFGPEFLKDSTEVTFKWDENSKSLQGQYAGSKITEAQVLTYYVTDNELLFINAYYNTLKKQLLNKEGKKWLLIYLNQVKNHEAGNETSE
jgi:hypothetical protein